MTQLYQSEALIGATLLSLFLSLPLSHSPLTYNLFPKSHLDGVDVPLQVQYSMYKDGK